MKRSPMPIPLAGGSRKQRKPMPRGTGLPAVSTRRAAGGTVKSATTRRSGGNSGPTPGVRLLVLERDGYRCACGCRKSVIGQRYSLGHRLRASQGGRAVPSNLLTFLGWGGEACHGRIDSRRDARDEANGLTVRSWQDPAQVPVLLTLPDGSRVSRYLWDDGTCRDEPQSAVAA